MACGTGKTLTCFGVAEQVGARTVLVLLPSLPLLAQTMREWWAQSAGHMAARAVCSDASVYHGMGSRRSDDDEQTMDAAEVPAQLANDPADLASFLTGAGEDPIVVFSTYHSSPTVAAAVQLLREGGRDFRFDLVVADEAHYLAGHPSDAFATVLSDALIPAARRVFTTATPRLVSAKIKDRLAVDGVDAGVQSMDDHTVFGPVAHRLSFGQAIEEKLLSNYQVLILGVEDQDVSAAVQQRALVSLAADDVQTERGHVGHSGGRVPGDV